MNGVNDEFLERYQKIWDEDQTSRVFAPLAEAYRRSGNLQRALQICRQGLNLHPSFAGGWYQIAKIFKDRQEFEKAIDALKKAISLAPEHIQAHSLIADLYLSDRQPKEALKAFKMVLLLNPEDVRAKKTIERLESLTADEYSPETFEIGPTALIGSLQETEDLSAEADSPFESGTEHRKNNTESKALKQTVTLVDALLVRNEFTKAQDIVLKAIERFGESPELESRLQVIDQQQEKSFDDESPEIIQPVPPRPERIRRLKINKLEHLLGKFKPQDNSEQEI
ncbi:MAG: hypothetical protein RJB66_948 [Pseudomonadota bacterium]|jgi:tetratricopeptide (TPR) repeat protein